VATRRGNGRAARPTVRARPAVTGTAPKRSRMSADERRRSILQAARRAFSESGDVNGTTVKTIAELGGISEGVIYRHFESKEQLFIEAIVEPLEDAIHAMVATTRAIGPQLTNEEQDEAMALMYKKLARMFGDILPLLGLVLFGDPVVAKRFYRETLMKAMDQLSEGWQDFFADFDVDVPVESSTRAVFGVGLMLALDSRFRSTKVDLDRAAREAGQISLHGFFPPAAEYTKRKAVRAPQ
jgi:AcrR family transcriptional regulator